MRMSHTDFQKLIKSLKLYHKIFIVFVSNYPRESPVGAAEFYKILCRISEIQHLSNVFFDFEKKNPNFNSVMI